MPKAARRARRPACPSRHARNSLATASVSNMKAAMNTADAPDITKTRRATRYRAALPDERYCRRERPPEAPLAGRGRLVDVETSSMQASCCAYLARERGLQEAIAPAWPQPDREKSACRHVGKSPLMLARKRAVTAVADVLRMGGFLPAHQFCMSHSMRPGTAFEDMSGCALTQEPRAATSRSNGLSTARVFPSCNGSTQTSTPSTVRS